MHDPQERTTGRPLLVSTATETDQLTAAARIAVVRGRWRWAAPAWALVHSAISGASSGSAVGMLAAVRPPDDAAAEHVDDETR
jgi:hypothetical protein